MILSHKLLKLGREKQILEVRDNLQINDFWQETGYVETTVHGRYSRIAINIVDTKNGNKDKAKIGEFNLTPSEMESLFSLLQPLNGDKFKEKAIIYNSELGVKCDYFKLMKIHHFTKNREGKSPVYNFSVSYEAGMRTSSKWKISIETGEGIAECSNKSNGARLYFVKDGTYKSLTKVQFFMNNNEINSFVRKVSRHIRIWEELNYPKMLEYREQFDLRAKMNKYNEDTIKEWNSKSSGKNEYTHSNEEVSELGKENNNTNLNKDAFNIAEETEHISDDNEVLCSECNKQISKHVAEYTIKACGRYLCLECKSNCKA